MAANSPQEQLMLELVNRARMNPAAEAARFGIPLNEGLPAGTISATPKQVLAMNDLLVISSDRHSNWMLVNDRFDHLESAGTSGFTGISPTNRMTAAGYAFTGSWSNGENISWTGTTGTIDPTAAIISQHQDLFLSEHHRENILADAFREVGVGQQLGQFTAQTNQGPRVFNASMVTQNFALSGNKLFITGVVYNDTVVNDNFFSIGEQTAGRTVSATGPTSDTTGAGGGYELGFTSAGVKTVAFNLVGGEVRVNVSLGTTNLKVDIVNGKEVWTNANLGLVSGPVTELHALGILGISLTGAAGNELLFGNVAANRLTGGAGNDTLDGAAGADRLLGQAGNDIYKVDNAGDVVDETGGTGTDVVQSIISFNLGNTARVIGTVEALQLTGSAAINGTGNALANAITGNAANNGINGAAGNDVLNGAGGNDTLDGSVGADRMLGQAGNDIYRVDNAGDVVNETGGTGTDAVQSSISFSLSNTTVVIGAVESLQLTGSAAINGVGNALANSLTGNGANNALNGAAGNDALNGGAGTDTLTGSTGNDALNGGAGIDTLTGSTGNDAFVFNAPLSAANRDVIIDFANAAGNDDLFRLENAVFTKLTAGLLLPANFRAGATALDADDFIVYNQPLGALSYDADGVGAGLPVQFATLNNKAALTANDFVVI